MNKKEKIVFKEGNKKEQGKGWEKEEDTPNVIQEELKKMLCIQRKGM